MTEDKTEKNIVTNPEAEGRPDITQEVDEWIELDSSDFREDTNVKVRIETLQSFADSERIQQLVRHGTIIFLRIRDLRQRDLTQLKRAVDKLKKTCHAMNGDIIGVDEDFLVLTPNTAKIFRG